MFTPITWPLEETHHITMYDQEYRQQLVVVSRQDLEEEKRPSFYVKKYIIVAISVLTLLIWFVFLPTEVIINVLNSHWKYTRRHKAFLDIFLNLIVISISVVHSIIALIGAFGESYFYTRVHLDFCITFEFLWLFSVYCSLVNIFCLMVNTVWMLLVLLFLMDLKMYEKGDVRYFFL